MVFSSMRMWQGFCNFFGTRVNHFSYTPTLYIHTWKHASACKLDKYHPTHPLYKNHPLCWFTILLFTAEKTNTFWITRHKVFCKWETSGIRWKLLNNRFLLSFCSSFFPLALLPCHSFLKVRRRTEEQLNPSKGSFPWCTLHPESPHYKYKLCWFPATTR